MYKLQHQLRLLKKQLRRTTELFVKVQPINQLLRALLRRRGQTPNWVKTALPVVGVVRVQFPNCRPFAYYANGDDQIVDGLYWDGISSFEGETVRLFLSLVRHARCVLDIGANTGIYALLAGIQSADVQVYAFEPVPEIAARLRRNIALNHLSSVQVVSSVVSDVDGPTSLYVAASAKGRFTTNASTRSDFRASDRIITVPSITVDSFVTLKGIAKVDLIKIDTETTEPAVIMGGKATIFQHAPLIICEVLFGETERALHDMLDGCGYEYYWISPAGLVKSETIVGDKTYACMNWIFVPESKRKFITPYLATL